MTDHKLLELLRTDRNNGMTLLIQEYSGLVFSVAKGILSDVCNSSEIEDCVTDVFLKFQKGLDGFKPEASVKTYLGIIARNTALNMRRNMISPLSTDEDDFFAEIADDRDIVEEIAEKELVNRIFKEIAEMGHPDSDIMFRKYYLGQSSKTIADKMNMTVSNVDTRAHRAVKKLKAKFGGESQ
ncbi:MAG: sigma-70 family RNA polymerase sigma factor [Clostridia bacterium]|nr:sigma-70 family RNA polymerase sigma factor [Clostridia bacterium]